MADKLIASCCTSNSSTTQLRPAVAARPPCDRHEHHRSLTPCPSSTAQLLLRAQAVSTSRRATSRAPRSGSAARVTCLFDGEKRDATRKALESALGDKKEAFSKWDEEIKKREASGGGGGSGKGRGRGWGSGGGGGDKGGGGGDDASERSESGFQWGESLQVVYAFFGLASLYLVLTQGSKMLALVLNGLLWVSRGFKARPVPRYAPAQQSGSAEDHVRGRWGSDD